MESGIYFKHEAPADSHFGSGAAWIDFDRDGDVDLYVTQRIGVNRLYENTGGGRFVEISGALGADDPSHDGGGVSVADFNNDGWPDLYLANGDEDILFKNMNGTSFVDVTTSANLSGQGASTGQTPSWGDFNQDGFLDLYVSNHLPQGAESPQDRLFVNNGDETFTDLSDILGLENLKGFAFIAGWTDFDDDGDLDIFLVNDCPFGPTVMRFFRNGGGADAADWQFDEISTELGIDYCAAGMGIAVGDLDRDGSFDYFHTNIGRPNLLRNTFGLLTDKTADSGILPRAGEIESGALRWTWGCNFLDYDNDGWLDLYIAAGSFESENDRQENLLYRNLGNGFTFEDVTDICGAADTLRSRTSIVADYDGDGDLDIFVVNYGDSARLYRNDTNSGYHFLRVGLEGTVSNRDGIGARVRV
ncbi:MAG: VCBS repeat-containing protein, partial [bacterium]|nr:VCBS repeat-containing protein [bacterium]